MSSVPADDLIGQALAELARAVHRLADLPTGDKRWDAEQRHMARKHAEIAASIAAGTYERPMPKPVPTRAEDI